LCISCIRPNICIISRSCRLMSSNGSSGTSSCPPLCAESVCIFQAKRQNNTGVRPGIQDRYYEVGHCGDWDICGDYRIRIVPRRLFISRGRTCCPSLSQAAKAPLLTQIHHCSLDSTSIFGPYNIRSVRPELGHSPFQRNSTNGSDAHLSCVHFCIK
jgi:hypothetical protein